MLAVTAEFLLGHLRAASADDSTLTGTPSPEWPPSPARLYQAFVASGGTSSQAAEFGGVIGLDLLEGRPTVLANSLEDVAVTPQLPRYVVVDERARGTVMNYPARKAQSVRPGAKLAPKNPLVCYVWPHIEPTDAQISALQTRAARLSYLGTADSPVRMTVTRHVPADAANLPSWAPAEQGDIVMAVAYSGFLQALDGAFDAFSGNSDDPGAPRRSAWIPREFATYRSPHQALPSDEPQATTFWLRLDTSLSGRRVLQLTHALRSAILVRADEVAGGSEFVPEVLHGHHAAAAAGVEHVRFLALPHVGSMHADGRIFGACVWLPPGTPAQDIALARTAVGRVKRLINAAGIDVAVVGFDGTRAPWASNPARWIGPARKWQSAFPVVYERWPKGELSMHEVSKWCAFAGLPPVVAFRVSRTPFLKGAVTLSPEEISGGRHRRPYSHMEIEFAENELGPIALGQGRHFGLGLFAPVTNAKERRS